MNELNIAVTEFENSAIKLQKENSSLSYQIEQKDKTISNLTEELSAKDKIINKLKNEKDSIKTELQKFKSFWHKLMSHFHTRICYDKNKEYKVVSDDLYKNGIFDDNENEIANNIFRKVTIPDKNENSKNKNGLKF